MSIAVLNSSLLSVCSRVEIHADRLEVRTPRLWLLLTIGLRSRRTIIDRMRRVIVMRTRWFWLFQSERRIKYGQVDSIDTSFGSFTTDWSPFVGSTDQLEKYTVGVKLRGSRDVVPLYAASGEGSIATGGAGVLLGGDSLIDLSGNQESQFHLFVDLLRVYLGLIDKPLSDWHPYHCSNCGRIAPGNHPKCMQCGGRLAAAEEPPPIFSGRK